MVAAQLRERRLGWTLPLQQVRKQDAHAVLEFSAQVPCRRLQLICQMLHIEPVEVSGAKMSYLLLGPRQQVLVVERLLAFDHFRHLRSSGSSTSPIRLQKPSAASRSEPAEVLD